MSQEIEEEIILRPFRKVQIGHQPANSSKAEERNESQCQPAQDKTKPKNMQKTSKESLLKVSIPLTKDNIKLQKVPTTSSKESLQTVKVLNLTNEIQQPPAQDKIKLTLPKTSSKELLQTANVLKTDETQRPPSQDKSKLEIMSKASSKELLRTVKVLNTNIIQQAPTQDKIKLQIVPKPSSKELLQTVKVLNTNKIQRPPTQDKIKLQIVPKPSSKELLQTVRVLNANKIQRSLTQGKIKSQLVQKISSNKFLGKARVTDQGKTQRGPTQGKLKAKIIQQNLPNVSSSKILNAVSQNSFPANHTKKTVIRHPHSILIPSKVVPTKSVSHEQPKKVAPVIDLTLDAVTEEMDVASTQSEYRCAYLHCPYRSNNKLDNFVAFPKDYSKALLNISLCSRRDILHLPKEEIKQFIDDSPGVCLVHNREINIKLAGTRGKPPNRDDVLAPMLHNIEPRQPVVTYVPVKEYCAFKSCATYIRNKLVNKYRFPSDPKLLKSWMAAADIAPFINPLDLRPMFVCGKHFTPEQYTEWNTLKMNSIPTSSRLHKDFEAKPSNIHWYRKNSLTFKKYTPYINHEDREQSIIEQYLKMKARYYEESFSEAAGTENVSTVQESGIVTAKEPQVADQRPSPIVALKVLPPPAPELKQQVSVLRLQPVVNFENRPKYVKPPITMKCAVRHCKETEDTSKLFRFPCFLPIHHYLWAKAIENSPSVSATTLSQCTDMKICIKHFEKRFLHDDNTLKQNAVPTVDIVDPSIQPSSDTSITWTECPEDRVFEEIQAVKNRAILNEYSIDFPALRRELRFGAGCPKQGINRFPYKIYPLPRSKLPINDIINAGRRAQVHSAIIVDDDDESEAAAIQLIADILKRNEHPVKGNKRKLSINYQ